MPRLATAAYICAMVVGLASAPSRMIGATDDRGRPSVAVRSAPVDVCIPMASAVSRIRHVPISDARATKAVLTD